MTVCQYEYELLIVVFIVVLPDYKHSMYIPNKCVYLNRSSSYIVDQDGDPHILHLVKWLKLLSISVSVSLSTSSIYARGGRGLCCIIIVENSSHG